MYSPVIVGIDEVGRGCLAGPLVAAAVILNNKIKGLNDSKLLSRTKRESLASEIYKTAKVGIGIVEVSVINRVKLTKSVSIAMSSALDDLDEKYDQIIIDGNYNYLYENEKVSILIKADQLIACVSAASIIAKVYRDKIMREMAIKYPNYGFETHVGYGTKYHLSQLKKYGPSELHRTFYQPVVDLLN